jgi:hypothetical protein
MINHYTANKKVRNDDAYSSRRRDRLATRPRHFRLLPACPRSVQGRADHRRRRRSVTPPHGPLRLLERQGQTLDPAGQQGRPGRLRHGRERDRGNRRGDWTRAKRSKIFATCAEPPIALGAKETPPPEVRRSLLDACRVYEEVSTDKLMPSPKRLASSHNETNPQRPAADPAHGTQIDRLQRAADCRSAKRRWIAIYGLPYHTSPSSSYTEPIPAFEMIKNSVTIMRGCFRRLHVLFDHRAPRPDHPVA